MNGIRAPPTDSHNRYSQCLTKVYISMNKINIPSPPCLLWYNSQSPQSFNNITYNNTTITVHSSSSTTPHGYYNYISSSASHLRVLNHRRSTTWLAEDNKVIKCMWILPPLLPLKWFHFVNESTDAIHSVNVNLCRHHPFNLPGDQQKQLVARTDKFSSLHSPRTPGLVCPSSALTPPSCCASHSLHISPVNRLSPCRATATDKRASDSSATNKL